ncbi:adenylate/guanylate cyclase domain-containing protein [Phenylobacterium sp.]|uniref:adenylate/guanylate cyclase domain-containing protein n=1 Tax=Phenylobacterium sp. TaxID=1871053 RepID=UPI0035697627
MTRAKVQRRLTAILAADVVGYSGLVAADEAGTLSQFADHLRDLITPLVAEHDGRIIKTTGDGLLVEFASVVNALQCAIQIQAGVVERNAPLAIHRRLEFRMGLHAADVVIDSGDIFGEGVNVAARLEGLADPGGICVSARVQEDTHGRLEVEFDDLGEQMLKNMPRPVRVYQVRRDGAPPRPALLALPDKPSVAVLPFQNRSGDPEQEYFADAITEDIVTALSRWRWFFVIGRNSSFAYKDRDVDVAQVGRELGVRYVLQGSVRKLGRRVRVTAQLIEATSASNIWADSFDRQLEDLLALQDEITEQVVGAIEPAMLHSEGARIARKDLKDFNALDCFQRGMWHMNKVTEPEYRLALTLFREAIARDPDLALGHIGLARALYGGAVYGWSTEALTDLMAAREAAHTAIRLDPRDAYGYFASSGASLFLRRHGEALTEARKTVALNPNFGFGHFRLGQVLIYAGRPGEAIAPIERSLRYSPYDPQQGPMLSLLALAHYHAGQFEDAIRHAESATAMRDVRGAGILAASLARSGRLDEARRAFPPQLEQLAAGRQMRPGPYARESDREDFIEGLRLAGVGPVVQKAIS